MSINIFENWPIQTIEIDNSNYPKSLKKISNPPKKIFYRGCWNNNIFDRCLAVVGSRRMTKYGELVIEKMMPEIVAKNITIVSGFMYGIDTESHRQCVELGGKTIAVLGSGLDEYYPRENRKLYLDILINN